MYSQLYGQILDSPVGQLAHGHDNYSVLSLLADVGGKLYYNGSELGGSGGTTGTNDHDKLINRNKAGQHPMSAIAGLDAALLSKAYISGSISQDFAARRLRSHTLLLPTGTPDLLEGEYALTVLSTGFSGETPGGGSGIGYMRDLQDVTFENLTDDHAPVYVTAVSKFQNKRVSLYGHTHTEYASKAGDLNQDFSARRLKSRTLLIPTSDTLDLQTGEYALTILASGFSGETPSGGAAINVLSDVGDVQLTDLADYQVLMRYSNNWVNRTLLKSHIADFPTTWAWSALSGIPTTFTPAAHTHTKSQITDFPSNLTHYTGPNYSGLQYWNTQNNLDLNPNANWWYGIRMAHGDADTYYNTTLAFDFHSDNIKFRRKAGGVNMAWQTLWHTGNHGQNSGLDADLLDGLHWHDFTRSIYGDAGFDFNTIGFNIFNGFIARLEANALNPPISGIYNWTLIQQGNSIRGSQIAIGAYNGQRIFFRGSNTEYGWPSWNEIWHNNNLSNPIRGEGHIYRIPYYTSNNSIGASSWYLNGTTLEQDIGGTLYNITQRIRLLSESTWELKLNHYHYGYGYAYSFSVVDPNYSAGGESTMVSFDRGNVGVKTLSPYSALDVLVRQAGIKYLTISTDDGFGSWNDYGINFRIANIGHDIARIKGFYINSGDGGDGGVCFATRMSGVLYNRLSISHTGNVSIGPDYDYGYKLGVNGTGYFGDKLLVKHNNQYQQGYFDIFSTLTQHLGYNFDIQSKWDSGGVSFKLNHKFNTFNAQFIEFYANAWLRLGFADSNYLSIQSDGLILFGYDSSQGAYRTQTNGSALVNGRFKTNTLLIPTGTPELQAGEYALTVLSSGFSGENPPAGAINVLSDVGDVTLADLADYQVLMRISNSWVNRSLLKAHIADFPTTWAWSALTGIPSTFTPAAHTHTKSQISDFAHNHDSLYMPIAPADDSISASKILQSSTRRFVTDSEKSAWSAKWDYNENTIKAVKVNSAADSDKLLSHTLYDLTYHSIYNPSNGLLITTDISASSEAMFSIEITGNGYSGENLNATFSGYWSNSAATFYQLRGFSAGGVTAISSFVSNGFLCFHVQPSVTFQTYRVWVSCETRKNRVILLYNAAKPAGRTSEQNTTLNIMRHSGNFRAGLEYQTPIAAGTYAPFTHYHDYLSIYGGTVAGAINVTDSTSATSSTTGALRVAGGISTQNNLHVGNELVAAKMRIPKWNSFSPPTGLQSGQYYLYIIE